MVLPSAVPTQSTRQFVAPFNNPIKKSPPINDLISEIDTPKPNTTFPENIGNKQSAVLQPEVINQPNIVNPPNVINQPKEVHEVNPLPQNPPNSTMIPEQPIVNSEVLKSIQNNPEERISPIQPISEEMPTEVNTTVSVSSNTDFTKPDIKIVPCQLKQELESPNEVVPTPSKEITQSNGNFSDHWKTLFELIFKDEPIIFFSFNGVIPQLSNNNVIIELKNDIQKEHFECHTREVLEYLRNNYCEQIEDIIINISDKAESKKIIIDAADKMKNFMEINSEFGDFLEILDLKMDI